LLGRVHLGPEPGARTHLVILVTLDNQDWLIDVGFGHGCPRKPIRLGSNSSDNHDGVEFQLMESDFGYMLQQQSSGEWGDRYSFDLSPVFASDIAMSNHYTSTSDQSIFCQFRIATLCRPQGETRLRNFRCTTVKNNIEQVTELSDSPVYLQQLQDEFGIELQANYDDLNPLAD